MLIVYAHPDDESFGNGGSIARYVAEGAEVYLICATNGDVGSIPEEMQHRFDTVAELRLAELDCAAQILGIKKVYRFGYRDSGMMGSDDNQNPDSLWYMHEHEPDVVLRRVVEVVREVCPQVIVTFNRYGGYGHPDHIAIMRAAEQAFYLAGDADYETPGLEPWTPQKLYFTALPAFLLRMVLRFMRLRGQDPTQMGVNHDIDFVKIVDNLDPVHTRIDVGKYIDVWWQANDCHASQGGGRVTALPAWIMRRLNRSQGYTRVFPPPARDRVDEHDLFAGVR